MGVRLCEFSRDFLHGLRSTMSIGSRGTDVLFYLSLSYSSKLKEKKEEKVIAKTV